MSANGVNAFKLDVTASILPADLTNAVADAYSDTVNITILW
jgi:spore coat protein U-like protein